MIFGTGLKHRYKHAKSDALSGVDIKITPGEFVAVCGANGSGKSTLARHLNALLTPTEGTLFVDGHDTADVEKLLDIHKACGMVFQNPDNQIIGSVVEEDTAFGPENIGIPSDEMQTLVDSSLEKVGLLPHKLRSTNELSGGQKQRLAIAGVLAMLPRCIVLDEPTAMLDPSGRKEVLSTLKKLHEDQGITIVLITHHMDEILDADRVIVMDEGRIVKYCSPEELIHTVPSHSKLAELLEGLMEHPETVSNHAPVQDDHQPGLECPGSDSCTDFSDPRGTEKLSIVLHDVSYSYNAGTPSETCALGNVDLTFREGCFYALIGKTGSGKSTLIKMLNRLLLPTSGEVTFHGFGELSGRELTRFIRSEVGMVFQYPENQLFAQTVIDDVCYGIKNFAPGLSPDETRALAIDALTRVGISEELYERSPFDLSGGEKRRVAIAGVLALKPSILVMDEPTAGLDPEGSKQLMNLLDDLHSQGTGIVLVSHNMDEVAEHAEQVIFMDNGRVAMNTSIDSLSIKEVMS